MNTMTYLGYAASIVYSDDDGCFIGHIAGIKDRVGFHGQSVIELKSAFHEAVDDYLEACVAVGKSPQKPFSGKLMLRISEALHARVAQKAQVQGKSINQWIAELLAWELSDTSEEETRFLLSNEANRKHLEKSIRQYRNR